MKEQQKLLLRFKALIGNVELGGAYAVMRTPRTSSFKALIGNVEHNDSIETTNENVSFQSLNR